ncbi:hypothetical protein LOZ65_006623 [Ophidiomyces ophidiicola]|nr:hypothetical protein LOZ65_006623 [Ophidiomyces ophidiicola]
MQSNIECRSRIKRSASDPGRYNQETDDKIPAQDLLHAICHFERLDKRMKKQFMNNTKRLQKEKQIKLDLEGDIDTLTQQNEQLEYRLRKAIEDNESLSEGLMTTYEAQERLMEELEKVNKSREDLERRLDSASKENDLLQRMHRDLLLDHRAMGERLTRVENDRDLVRSLNRSTLERVKMYKEMMEELCRRNGLDMNNIMEGKKSRM